MKKTSIILSMIMLCVLIYPIYAKGPNPASMMSIKKATESKNLYRDGDCAGVGNKF